MNFSVLVTLFKHLLLSAHRPVISSYLFFELSKQSCHALLRNSPGYSVCKFLLTCTNTERLMVAKYLIIVKSNITFRFLLRFTSNTYFMFYAGVNYCFLHFLLQVVYFLCGLSDFWLVGV